MTTAYDRLVASLVMAAVALFTAAGPARAQQNFPQPVIAVLDYQQILRAAKAARDIRAQVESYRKDYQSQISVKEQRLKQEEEELRRQRTILAADAFEGKKRAFEQKVISVQREVQDHTRELERALDGAMEKLRQAIIPIVKDMTVEMGFNIVVDRSQVMFAANSLDVTEIVVSRLDETLPKVQVVLPQ